MWRKWRAEISPQRLIAITVCDRQAYGQIDRQKCCVSICAVLMHDTKSYKDYNDTNVVCGRLIKIHNFLKTIYLSLYQRCVNIVNWSVDVTALTNDCTTYELVVHWLFAFSAMWTRTTACSYPACASSDAPLMASCRRQQCSADSPSR